MRKTIGLSLLFFFVVSFGLSLFSSDVIRVPLKRIENKQYAFFMTFYFENNQAVWEKAKKKQIKLPDQLMETAFIGFTRGDLPLIIQEVPQKKTYLLTVDSNRNNDLRDDKTVERKIGEGAVIPIKCDYSNPECKTEWLPIFFNFKSKTHNNKTDKYLLYTAHYRMKGNFEANGEKIGIELLDSTSDGKFTWRDLTKATAIILTVRNKTSHHWGHELFQLGKDNVFYRFHEMAENGSWISFIRTQLRPARLNQPAPDFTLTDIKGNRFNIKGLEEKVVMLDFWASWCRPCVSEFKGVKEFYKKITNKPVEIIGICIDTAERVNKAKDIALKEYKLPWRQVIEGKGHRYPIWQVYGSLPEKIKFGIPLYVIIDQSGIIRFGDRDIKKVESLINQLLKSK